MHRSFWDSSSFLCLPRWASSARPSMPLLCRSCFDYLVVRAFAWTTWKPSKQGDFDKNMFFERTTISFLSLGQLRQLWSTCFFRSFGLWIAYDDITVPMLLHGWGPYGSMGQDKLFCWLYLLLRATMFLCRKPGLQVGQPKPKRVREGLGSPVVTTTGSHLN